MYEVKTKVYAGPLEKLLELIEERKLEITTISLAEVTGDFLTYVKTLANVNQSSGGPTSPPLEEHQFSEVGPLVADFLVVAAKLILIKSKALLPTLALSEEEEREIYDLEARLKIYKEYKAASLLLKQQWEAGKRSFSRELFSGLSGDGIFYPGKNVSLETLSGAAERLAALIREFLPETREIKRAVVTLEEKIKELLNRVAAAAEQSFKTITAGKPKIEAILLFLAILHLFRDRLVSAEQEERFGDIIIVKREL